MDIQVTQEVFGLATAGLLTIITCELDPQADKRIAEGERPSQVSLQARGSRKAKVTFQVIGADQVKNGYVVRLRNGRKIATMTRDTSRVVIGKVIEPLTTSEDATDDIDS